MSVGSQPPPTKPFAARIANGGEAVVITHEDVDRAHDRVRVSAARAQRGFFSRARLLWLLVGPGVLVMLGENDGPSMLSYAATGAKFGIGFFLPICSPYVLHGDCGAGNDGATGRRHPSRTRRVDLRALRAVLGLVFDDRSGHRKLSYAHHRVHRHPRRLGLFWRSTLDGNPDRAGHSLRSAGESSLLDLGTNHAGRRRIQPDFHSSCAHDPPQLARGWPLHS